jgi:hypothetical protein
MLLANTNLQICQQMQCRQARSSLRGVFITVYDQGHGRQSVDAQRLRGGRTKVDHPPLNVWTSIVDPDDRRAALVPIDDGHFRAKG